MLRFFGGIFGRRRRRRRRRRRKFPSDILKVGKLRNWKFYVARRVK